MGGERTMYDMTNGQFQVVYDILSFSLASMMASTIFFWIRVSSVSERYKSAMVITGLVTFIAAYHYIRIFNSWVEAYDYPAGTDGITKDPVLTGVPFNDAYRYMDWLLTVPLLLIEIVFVMNLTPQETSSKATRLGIASGLMIVIGYPGELILESDELSKRWLYWGMAMIPFGYVVYELMVGLRDALESEEKTEVRDLIWWAQRATVVSWLTYPVVYIIPMFGATGASAVVGIQMGYCLSDIISKCGVGLLIYNISMAKSRSEYAALNPNGKGTYGTRQL